MLGHSEDLQVRLGARDAVFESGGTRLTTRLIEGDYPNYRNLLPSSYPNVLTVGRDALLEALRRVKILAQDATPVRLHLGGDTLRLSAITQDVGNASEEIDATYDGAEMTVAFNPEYLAAGVDAVDARGDHAVDDGSDEAGGDPRRRPRRLPVPADAGAGALKARRGPAAVIVERLALVDFRNYADASFRLTAGTTVVVGDNGQGKTNLAEALAYLATLASFRGAPPDALVRIGCVGGRAAGRATRRGRAHVAHRGRAGAGRAQPRAGQPPAPGPGP